METKYDVVIIGGGAVGLCAAHFLRKESARVAVVDQTSFADGASWVNAGLLVPSHIEPIAAPGVITQGLKWLADPESPFYIKPRVDMDLTRWLWGFQAACTDKNVENAIPILRDLALASLELHGEMAGSPGFEKVELARDGLLMLHNSEKSERSNLALADMADDAGLSVKRLTKDETLDMEPAVRTRMNGAVLFRDDAAFDPEEFMKALVGAQKRDGVDFIPETAVKDFETSNGRVVAVRTDSGSISGDHFVIAAGAWAGLLCKKLDCRIPIEPATGYSITIENPESNLKIPVIVTDQKLTVTPMPGRLRFGGTLTLVGFDEKIDARRIRPLERQARLYCPELDASGRPLPAPRSGFRPCTTDGLPVIGKPSAWPNVIIASGHGMLGMTEGPITGQLVADLFVQRKSNIDISALSPDRF